MDDLINCHAMELLCCQRALLDPEHSWNWLARAERWINLGHRKIASRFEWSNLEQPDLGPMGASEIEALPGCGWLCGNL